MQTPDQFTVKSCKFGALSLCTIQQSGQSDSRAEKWRRPSLEEVWYLLSDGQEERSPLIKKCRRNIAANTEKRNKETMIRIANTQDKSYQ